MGPPPLAALPLDDLEAALADRLAAADPAARARLLAEADGLRGAPGAAGDASWRVVAAYRALVDEALTGPDAAARAAYMVAEDPTHDAVTRRFADVARRRPGHPGILATAVWAECDGDAAHLAAAVPALLGLRRATRGRGDADEFAVLHALGDVFLRQHREFEALVAARHADRVARGAAGMSSVDHAHAVALLARAYVALGDRERLEAHLPRMLEAAATLEGPDADRARAHAHLLRARLATDVGDLDAAEAAVAVAGAALARAASVPGHGPAILRSAQHRLAAARRDAKALGALVAERGAAATPPTLLATLAVLEDDLARARVHATAALSGLARPGQPPSSRLRAAAELARALDPAPTLAEVAAEAWRHAADAALDRLHELDHSVRDLGPVGPPTEDDLDALAGHRARFVAAHGALLGPLRARVAEAARAGAVPAWATPPAGDLLLVCAWCLSVRDPSGAWLPLGHLVHGASSLPTTHGACPRCLATLLPAARLGGGAGVVSPGGP